MGILQAFDHKTLIISGAAGSRTLVQTYSP